VREVLNRIVGFAVPDSQEPTEEPGSREVRIEHERPVKQGDAAIEVADEMAEHMTASREGDRIIPAQLDRPAGQPNTFGDVRSIGDPAVDFAPEIAPRRHPVGRCEVRIELYRLIEQRQSLVDRLPSSLMKVRHSAEIVVVGVEIFGGLALRAFDFGQLQLRRDRADDVFTYLILQLEDVSEVPSKRSAQRCPPVVASMSCPVMRTRFVALRMLPSST